MFDLDALVTVLFAGGVYKYSYLLTYFTVLKTLYSQGCFFVIELSVHLVYTRDTRQGRD